VRVADWVCNGWVRRSYGVMVSTLDFESSDPGSNPGRSLFLRGVARVACGCCGGCGVRFVSAV